MADPVGGLDLQVESNLRQILADLREFDPKLATAVRRRLRQSADEAIAEMRSVLAEPSPGVVTGTTTGLSRVRADGSLGARRIRILSVSTAAAARSRSRGARAQVAAGLKTRVQTGATRQGIKVTGTGAPFARSYNMRVWRHPIRFDPATTSKNDVPWVSQGGRPYFGAVVLRRAAQMQSRVYEALDEALAAIARQRSGLPPVDD